MMIVTTIMIGSAVVNVKSVQPSTAVAVDVDARSIHIGNVLSLGTVSFLSKNELVSFVFL